MAYNTGESTDKKLREVRPVDRRNANRARTSRVTLCGLLLAIMLVLGWVEHMLPAVSAVPGIKLGLSNGVLIFAVYMLDLPTAWTLMALKVTLSGLLFSGLNAMLYAFAGGVLSMLVMTLLSRGIRGVRIPCVIVSMAGGAAHNIGQVLLAMRIAHLPDQMLVYMAILVGAGLACGLLTGVAADRVMLHLRGLTWLKRAQTSTRSRIASAVIVILAGVLAWALMWKPSGTLVITSTLDTPPAATAETEEVRP